MENNKNNSLDGGQIHIVEAEIIEEKNQKEK